MSEIIRGMEDNEYIVRCDQYTNYIDEHIRNVKQAFINLFRNPEKPFTNFNGIQGEKLDKVLNKLEMAINVHDSSKYLDEEFEGYRAHFYPTAIEQERTKTDDFYNKLIEANYNQAWFHHFITNDHHPLHWKWTQEVLTKRPVTQTGEDGTPLPAKIVEVKQTVALRTPLETARPMKPVAILHMICDWEAMSIKFGGNTLNWYKSDDAKDERNDLNPRTKEIVEILLRQLFAE